MFSGLILPIDTDHGLKTGVWEWIIFSQTFLDQFPHIIVAQFKLFQLKNHFHYFLHQQRCRAGPLASSNISLCLTCLYLNAHSTWTAYLPVFVELIRLWDVLNATLGRRKQRPWHAQRHIRVEVLLSLLLDHHAGPSVSDTVEASDAVSLISHIFTYPLNLPPL